MSPKRQDEFFMRRALALAATTVGLTSPNPQVGCVLVREDTILAEGVHLYDAFDHAEIAALKQAAQRNLDVAGSTAYVTLEPCSHHGRTGPCADALVAARIQRAVVATGDPNPQVSGRGIARLRAAGVEVTVGTQQQAARDLNEAFAHFIQHGRPFVMLKAALSVDGKLAPNPARRLLDQPHWLTGPAARDDVHRLRHASDAILTGIGTLLADNPALTDRSGLSRRRPLLRVVLDTHLRTPIGSQLVQTAVGDVLVFCAASAPAEKADLLREQGVDVERVAAQDGHLDLAAVLAALGRRNILSLLLECGSALNGSFLQEDLVDKTALYYAETELGPEAIPFAAGGPLPSLLEQRLKRVTRTAFRHGSGEDAGINGYLHDPWRSIGM